jgi:hypothetical protein
MRNWRKQLWVLVFTAGLSCLGQTVQPPLRATPNQGGTIFRLWAPFVDSVTDKVNDRELVRMSREDGRLQADATIWAIKVPGAEVGDRYKYLITANGVTREFIGSDCLERTRSQGINRLPANTTPIFLQSSLIRRILFLPSPLDYSGVACRADTPRELMEKDEAR